MLVVDIMHEFELGVWKSTFTHILQVLRLAAPGGKTIHELNSQYVPYFATRNHSKVLRHVKVPTDTYL